MDYRPSDSSGTDDDLPQFPHKSIRGSGRVSGNGRAVVPAGSYARAPTDMEKEGLMTELRKELRVSDKAHRELLNRVNNDNIICSIREWRSTGGLQASLSNNPQLIHDSVPSPTTSGRKRQKTSQSVPALPAPPPAMHSQQLATPTQPSSSTARKAVPPGHKGKKMKPGQKVPGGSAAKPIPSSAGPSGRGPHMNRGGSAPEAQAQNVDPLIGRKVMSRWPEDNSFYEAVIYEYDAETMGPEDIRWQEDDSGIDPVTYLRSRGGPTSGVRKPAGRGGPMPGSVRGRGLQKNMPKKDFPPPQNGVGKRSSDDIDILHTESLIKEVGKVFSVSNPDPQEVEKAKKALKEQEQSLIDAIARLAEASDGESDGHNRGRRNLYAANQHQASYVGAMPVGDRAGAM
ncbi:Protein EMSY-LIKE 3 [Zea mays]|uniref:Protein EMSY-LIKE 3 n=1 Tax=Zea mays TaxID=4577 RepID=A0A3L6G169_MAIZE|nr:Protein EMSY-LIKE 3 [Zea mays]